MSLLPVKSKCFFSLVEVFALAIKTVDLCRLVPVKRVGRLKLFWHLEGWALL